LWCLAMPRKVSEVFEDRGLRMARVDFGGTVKKACLEQLPEAALGDYVLVHVGYALSVVDPDEALRTYRFLEQLGRLDELDVPEGPAGSPWTSIGTGRWRPRSCPRSAG